MPRYYQEGGLSAVTGVGEPKMKEDEDQPLVPKPGNLISRTLGRIRKFFGFAGGGLMAYAGYADGGRVGYQNGGLAAVTSMPDDDEDERGQSLIQQALSRGKMNRDTAMRSLQTGREALLAQKRDKSAMWLRFAQGMLAPTKTGGFGESVGTTAGLVAGEKEAGREFELDRSQRLLEIEAEMRDVETDYVSQQMKASQQEAVNRRQSIGVPFDAYTQVDGKRIRAKAIVDVDEDGNEFIRFPRDTEGNVVAVPDRLDPEQRRQLELAREGGKLAAKDIEATVNKAFSFKEQYARALYGLELIDAIDEAGGTGGFQAIIQKAREFFGDEAQDVTDRGTLMNLVGSHLFKALESFGTQINRKELEVAQSLVASIARPSGINRSMLQNWAVELEWQMGYANNVAKKSGNQRLIDKMSTPLPNYGLSERSLSRAQRAGFTMAKHLPFEEREVAPPTAAVLEPGDLGTKENPFTPQSVEEAQELIDDANVPDGAIWINPITGKMKVIRK